MVQSDKPVIDKICFILHVSQPEEYNKARLLIASAAHRGDWLKALPICSCGFHLNGEAVKVN